MTAIEAIEHLEPRSKKFIKEIYDRGEKNSEAIFVLMPWFEYSNWCHARVIEFLDHISKHRCTKCGHLLF